MHSEKPIRVPWYLRLLGVVKTQITTLAEDQRFELKGPTCIYVALPVMEITATFWLGFQVESEVHYPDRHLLYDCEGFQKFKPSRMDWWTEQEVHEYVRRTFDEYYNLTRSRCAVEDIVTVG